ncbi:hypothetical protein BN873_570003 [Candidatus Competibacter denitrificans Run_A_D11]|uniref:Uncharacterized protein n=1 Tax=Candidatus Competibacter denitrificans Run_A_D11 TaxID=1400863 RepID=W6MBL6_9GAMM|nr:hypothetical protein BN873_570003 [Candidatus Competibacter denitrificans Run_A_D11]
MSHHNIQSLHKVAPQLLNDRLYIGPPKLVEQQKNIHHAYYHVTMNLRCHWLEVLRARFLDNWGLKYQRYLSIRQLDYLKLLHYNKYMYHNKAWLIGQP